MFIYGVTINKVSDPVFISDYEKFISMFHKKYPNGTFDYHYEEDRSGVQNRLHMHGTIRNHKKVKLTTILPKGTVGWHVHWHENPGPDWDRYIVKHSKKEINLINRSHAEEQEYKDFITAQIGYESDSDTHPDWMKYNIFTQKKLSNI